MTVLIPPRILTREQKPRFSAELFSFNVNKLLFCVMTVEIGYLSRSCQNIRDTEMLVRLTKWLIKRYCEYSFFHF